MSKRKTVFELDILSGSSNKLKGKIAIVGTAAKNKPYVRIVIGNAIACIKDKDLKLFAKNLKKALSNE